jgi:hypothetical protein
VRTLAFPLACLLVLAVPLALVAAAHGIVRWGRWVAEVAGVVGIAGLVVAGGFAVNLLVPRTCDRIEVPGGAIEEVNRPLLSLAVGDGGCFRSAVGQLQLVGLAGVATSAVAALAATRSGRGAVGAAPGAPTP